MASLEEGALAVEVIVPFFEGFQKLVRTFSPWGRHFLSICRTNFVRLIRDARLSGFPDEVARDPFRAFDLMSQRCGQFDTE
jgi:hypothetical protein